MLKTSGFIGLFFLVVSTYAQVSPGGVSQTNMLWMKANSGASTSSWTDAFTAGRTFTASNQGGGSAPLVLNTNVLNYNPAFNFAANSQYFRRTDNTLGTLTASNTTSFVVFRTSTNGRSTSFPSTQALFSSERNGFTNEYSFSIASANARLAYKGETSNTISATRNIVSSNNINTNLPFIGAATRSAVSNGVLNIFENGSLVVTNTRGNATSFAPSTTFGIGNSSRSRNTQQYVGDLAEIIVYPSVLTSTNRNRVESYLAIKYGITLGNTTTPIAYTSSTNTTFWGIAEPNYQSAIMGIGRDDGSALDQRIARSETLGSFIEIANGSSFPTGTLTAQSGTAVSANNSFAIVGSTTGATAFAPILRPGDPALNLPTVKRMVRAFKTQITQGAANGITAITLKIDDAQIPASASNTRLMIRTNNALFDATDYDNGIALGTPVNGFYQVTIPLNTGLLSSYASSGGVFYFGFAAGFQGPGNIPDIFLWLKADNLSASATSWQDDITGYTFTNANGGGSTPINLQGGTNPSTSINYTKYFDFAAGGQYFRCVSDDLSDLFSNASSVFVVQRTPTAITGSDNYNTAPTLFGGFRATTRAAYGFSIASGGRLGLRTVNTTTNTTSNLISTNAVNNASWTLSTAIRSVTSPFNASISVNKTTNTNGTGNGGSMNDGANAGRGFGIGNHLSPVASSQFTGEIAELVAYNRVLNATEINQLSSYLALKYGLTLGPITSVNSADYVNTLNEVIWDADALGGLYHKDVAGLGRQDASDLRKRQAYSVSPSNINSIADQPIFAVSIGNFAPTADANSSFIQLNNSYLIWGASDVSPITESNIGLPPGFGSCISRLSRTWRFQKTIRNGLPTDNLSLFDSIHIKINIQSLSGFDARNVNSFALVIDQDGDGDFTTGNLRYIQATNYNNTTGTVEFSGLNIDGDGSGADVVMLLTNKSGIATLINNASSTTLAANNCLDFGWNYLYDASNRRLAAVRLKGNTLGTIIVTQAEGTMGVGYNDATYLKSTGTTCATAKRIVLWKRVTQIEPSNAGPFTINGGVDVRLFYNPDTDSTNASNSIENEIVDIDPVAECGSIVDEPEIQWFKVENTATATPTTLTVNGFPPASQYVPLTPAVYGEVDGVKYVEFHNIQSFSSFGAAVTWGNGVTLPVKLLSFKANPMANNQDLLEWVGIAHPGTSHFEIEISSNGQQFKNIGRSSVIATDGVAYTYRFNALALQEQVRYYRIKIVELNGEIAYSNVIRLAPNNSANTFKIQLLNNPIKDQLAVQIAAPAPTTVQWKIVDASGKLWLSNQLQVTAGIQQQYIGAGTLPVGVYALQWTNLEGESQSLRFIKQ